MAHWNSLWSRHLSSRRRGLDSHLANRVKGGCRFSFTDARTIPMRGFALDLRRNHPGLLTGAQYFVIHRGTQQSAQQTRRHATTPSRPSSTLPSSVEDFVSKVLTLADEAGGFGLIVPSKMLDQVSYSSTREALISKGLNTALDLGNGFFPYH